MRGHYLSESIFQEYHKSVDFLYLTHWDEIASAHAEDFQKKPLPRLYWRKRNRM